MDAASNQTPPPSSPVNLLVIVPLVLVVAIAIVAIKCSHWLPKGRVKLSFCERNTSTPLHSGPDAISPVPLINQQL